MGLKLAACAAFSVALHWAPVVHPQAYPAKIIVVQAGHSVGSSGDTALRLISTKMAERLGQPLVIESRPGAGGAIAALAVKKAPPDGYTILSVGAGTMVSRQFLVKNVPYDAVKDFQPIGQFAKAVTFLTVHASVPAKSIRELVDLAKKQPGKLTYGSTGVGSPFHIMGETFKIATGTDIRHVPYAGGRSALAMNDLLTGTIKMYFPSYTNIRQYAGSDDIRLLGVTDTKRYRKLPDVPTISEAVPAFKPAPSWNGMFGPPGLPQPILNRLNAAMIAALDNDEAEQRMEEMGLRPIGNSPEEFARVLAEEITDFGKVVQALGLKAN